MGPALNPMDTADGVPRLRLKTLQVQAACRLVVQPPRRECVEFLLGCLFSYLSSVVQANRFRRMYTSAGLRYLPNLLTVGRILVTPLLLLLLTIPSQAGQASAVVLFFLASVSDYYDGVLARRYQVRSRLGQYLDPLADKILVLGTFGMLAIEEPSVVPWWAVAVIALRDVAVTALRSWIEAGGRTLHTYRIAKAKTMLQLAFLFGVLVLRTLTVSSPSLREPAVWLLRESPVPGVALAIVIGFTLATGALYLIAPVEERVDVQS